MIQRVQSLLLLAVSILMIVFLFVPIWKKEASHNDSLPAVSVTDKVVLKPFTVSYSRYEVSGNGAAVEKKMAKESTWYIGALAVLSAITALYSIFQYRNRMFQIKLGLLNALFMSGVLGTIFLGMNKGDDLLKEKTSEQFLIGFFIPAIALLLNIAANRFIKKDEELVRSADRIR